MGQGLDLPAEGFKVSIRTIQKQGRETWLPKRGNKGSRKINFYFAIQHLLNFYPQTGTILDYFTNVNSMSPHYNVMSQVLFPFLHEETKAQRG